MSEKVRAFLLGTWALVAIVLMLSTVGWVVLRVAGEPDAVWVAAPTVGLLTVGVVVSVGGLAYGFIEALGGYIVSLGKPKAPPLKPQRRGPKPN